MQLCLPSGVVLSTAWCTAASVSNIDLETALVLRYFKRLVALRNARIPLLNLAPELLHHIIDYVYALGGASSTKSCALVCTTLVPVAQMRLYRTASISHPRQLQRAAALFRTRPDLLQLVRELRLRETLASGVEDEWTDDPDEQYFQLTTWNGEVGDMVLSDMFKSFQNVRRLTFIASKHDDPCSLLRTPARSFVLHMFAHITHLTLRQYEEDESGYNNKEKDLCALVGFFPGLHTLYVDQVVDTTPDEFFYNESLPHFSWSGASLYCPKLQMVSILVEELPRDHIGYFIDRLRDTSIRSLVLHDVCDRADEPTVSFVVDMYKQLRASPLASLQLRQPPPYGERSHDSTLAASLRDAGHSAIRKTTREEWELYTIQDLFDISSLVDPSFPASSYTLRLKYKRHVNDRNQDKTGTLVEVAFFVGMVSSLQR